MHRGLCPYTRIGSHVGMQGLKCRDALGSQALLPQRKFRFQGLKAQATRAETERAIKENPNKGFFAQANKAVHRKQRVSQKIEDEQVERRILIAVDDSQVPCWLIF